MKFCVYTIYIILIFSGFIKAAPPDSEMLMTLNFNANSKQIASQDIKVNRKKTGGHQSHCFIREELDKPFIESVNVDNSQDSSQNWRVFEYLLLSCSQEGHCTSDAIDAHNLNYKIEQVLPGEKIVYISFEDLESVLMTSQDNENLHQLPLIYFAEDVKQSCYLCQSDR